MLDLFKTVLDEWKFRIRMGLALRDNVLSSLATGDELDRLVVPQVAYWRARQPLTRATALQVMQDLNNRSTSMFVVSIRGCKVRLWKKRVFSFTARDQAMRTREQRVFLRRAIFYRLFIETVLRRSGFDNSIDIVLDVNDMPEDNEDLPVFSFQKQQGAHNPLLPDVDFFHEKWYRKTHDCLGYEEKSISACFVGSSTGAWLNAKSIRDHETPRLHAADFFHGNPKVIFRIANAVQCVSEEAKALLTSQPYFCDYIGWEEQLRHRFIISMDGNGAACSRLVKGLLSNSVVIKFESAHELYYFPALRVDHDYLPVANEENLKRIVDSEIECPGKFREVALSGRRFAVKYLTVRSVMDYTVRLLNAFAAIGRN